jgi:hypothetical protein
LTSHDRIDPSATPSRIRRRRLWSISDFMALIFSLMAGLRSWSSMRTMHEPNSEVIATA